LAGDPNQGIADSCIIASVGLGDSCTIASVGLGDSCTITSVGLGVALPPPGAHALATIAADTISPKAILIV